MMLMRSKMVADSKIAYYAKSVEVIGPKLVGRIN